MDWVGNRIGNKKTIKTTHTRNKYLSIRQQITLCVVFMIVKSFVVSHFSGVIKHQKPPRPFFFLLKIKK